MDKQYIRFAKLVLDYFGEEDTSPENFSDLLKTWGNSEEPDILDVLGDPKTLEMLLTMIFKSRHRLKKDLEDPEFDRMAFFIEYQLNLPLEEAPLFAALFQGLPKELYKELADSSLNLTTMFVPEPF